MKYNGGIATLNGPNLLKTISLEVTKILKAYSTIQRKSCYVGWNK